MPSLPTTPLGWVLVLWPTITAVASIVYPFVDQTKWGHAVLSFLAALGVDLPKLLNALQRVFSAEARAKMARLAAFVIVLTFGTVGALVVACIPNPLQQAQDGVSLEQCVQNNWGKPVATVIMTCGPNVQSAILDIIADIVVFLDRETDGGASSAVAMYTSDPQVLAKIPAARARLAQAR